MPTLANVLAMGFELLWAISSNRHRPGGLSIVLTSAQILIAQPLPEDWQIPDRFWQVLRAVLCRQIWKTRNEHYMADRIAGEPFPNPGTGLLYTYERNGDTFYGKFI